MPIADTTINLFRIVSLFFVSFLAALAAFPAWYYGLLRWRLGKHIRSADGAPVFHSLHAKKSGTPTMGGLLIWAVPIILALLMLLLAQTGDFGRWLNIISRRETYLPLAFLAVAGIIGALDDLFGILRIGPAGGGISIRHKVIIYLALAALVGWWFTVKLGVSFIPIPFGERLYLGPVAYFAFLALFVFAMSFSANETDGLDGLLGGVGVIALLVLIVVAFLNGDFNLASLAAMVLGSVLAFLWFNIYPAKVFMGDTGSMALGIFLALGFLLEGIPLLAPIILPIFVLESGSVLLQVFWKKVFKRKLFQSTPIHHHFEALGNHESSIVFKFWVVSAVGAVLGLMLFVLDRYL